MVRVRHCLFCPFPFPFLFFPLPLPFLCSFLSFTLPFPFPRPYEFFDQGVKPALGKTVTGKTKNDNVWKHHLKGLGVFRQPHG